MSMMDDIEDLKNQNAELVKALKFFENLVNQLGQVVAPTIARAQALNRMLVLKGVCTGDELNTLEMQCMLELSGQLKPKSEIVDPTLKTIVKPPVAN